MAVSRLKPLQRTRSESMSILLGFLWLTRGLVLVCTLIAAVCGEWDVCGKFVLAFYVLYVTDKTLSWLFPRKYRTGAEWRAGKPDYN